MTPKFGLFTPYTLRFHSDYYNENNNDFLKRCFVLFDNLVFISPRKQDKDFVENIIRSECPDVALEIIKTFKPVNEFVSDDLLSEISFQIDPELNMCYGPNRNEFLIFIHEFLNKKFGIDSYNVNNRKEFEILDYYISALSADFNFLFRISKENKDISALFTELHRDAYFATFGGKTNVPERVLKKICSVNYFDFSNLTWPQILELKRSHFLSDFRVKFTDWLEEYSLSENIEKFEENINKYIRTSNFEFLKRNKPNLKKDIAIGVLGNIPIPIPNPVAILSSMQTVREDLKIKKDFGWLFFIQEAYYKSINNSESNLK